MTGNASLTSEIVSAVARTEDIEPLAVESTLFDAVDGDALERLFRNTTGHVTFEYDDYEVTVSSGGLVSLVPLGE